MKVQARLPLSSDLPVISHHSKRQIEDKSVAPKSCHLHVLQLNIYPFKCIYGQGIGPNRAEMETK